MKPEKQIAALAELDGWKETKETWHSPSGGRFARFIGIRDIQDAMILPAYLTSYDAIIPLIQRLNQTDILDWDITWSRVSPAQLAEALLRATGKWVD